MSEKHEQFSNNEGWWGSKSEAREKLPELELRFWFSAHGSPEDFEGLKEEFDKADVYVPESPGWTIEDLHELQGMASGEYNPDEIFVGIDRYINDMIAGSNKAIELIDIPDGHPLLKKYDKVQALFAEAEVRQFDSMILLVKKVLKEEAEIQKKREVYMHAQIEGLAPKIINDYPDLGNKDKLEVLISLGALHTPVYHKAREELSATRRIEPSPFIFGTKNEVARRINMKGDLNITDEEAAKVWLENRMYMSHEFPIEKSSDQSRYFRIALNQISFEDIRNLFDKDESVRAVLENKGFPIPNEEMSAKEFEKFLEECRLYKSK